MQVVVLRRTGRQLVGRLRRGRSSREVAFVFCGLQFRAVAVDPGVLGDAPAQRVPHSGLFSEDIHPVAAQHILGVEDDLVPLRAVGGFVLEAGGDRLISNVLGAAVLDQREPAGAQGRHRLALTGGVGELAGLVQRVRVERVGHLEEVILECERKAHGLERGAVRIHRGEAETRVLDLGLLRLVADGVGAAQPQQSGAVARRSRVAGEARGCEPEGGGGRALLGRHFKVAVMLHRKPHLAPEQILRQALCLLYERAAFDHDGVYHQAQPAHQHRGVGKAAGQAVKVEFRRAHRLAGRAGYRQPRVRAGIFGPLVEAVGLVERVLGIAREVARCRTRERGRQRAAQLALADQAAGVRARLAVDADDGWRRKPLAAEVVVLEPLLQISEAAFLAASVGKPVVDVAIDALMPPDAQLAQHALQAAAWPEQRGALETVVLGECAVVGVQKAHQRAHREGAQVVYREIVEDIACHRQPLRERRGARARGRAC